MKYGLFGFRNYYPEGGMNDFITSFNNVGCLMKDECFLANINETLYRPDKLHVLNFMTGDYEEIICVCDVQDLEIALRSAVRKLTYECSF